MTSILIPLVLLTLAALAAGYLFSRKLEDTLPVVMLSVMLLLYAFYTFNLLRAGRICVIAALAALPAAAVYRMIRKRDFGKFLKDIVFTPQTALYLGLIVLFCFLSQGKLVGIWDELRLWGSLPKALHAYGTLQFGEDAAIYVYSQSYPPAVPLLGYFFTSFSPMFSESALYFARAYFGLSLLLPLTRKLTWANWHGLAAAAFLMVFVPYYLTTNDPDFAFYYESLYVDAPAGILCGYLCWQAMDGCYKDRFSAAAFCAALMALTLTKDFGVLFGGLCVAGSIKWVLRAARQKQLKQTLIKAGLAAASLIAAYLSWQLLMRAYHVINYNTVTAAVPTFGALGSSLIYLFSSILTVNLFIASVTLPFGAAALLLLLGYAMFVYHGRETLMDDLPFILLRLAGYAGYFFAYVMMFRDDIAGGVFPSIARYMVAMLLCETYVFLMALMKASKRQERFLHRPSPSLSAGAKAAAVLLAVALAALSVFTVGEFRKYDGGVYGDAEDAAAVVAQNADAPEGEIADVWLLIGGDAWENSLLHHRVYFNLVGTDARIKTYILQTNVTRSGLSYTPESFLEALGTGGYDYVLVLYGDDELAGEFGALFPELIPYETDILLYKVRQDDGIVRLSLAN